MQTYADGQRWCRLNSAVQYDQRRCHGTLGKESQVCGYSVQSEKLVFLHRYKEPVVKTRITFVELQPVATLSSHAMVTPPSETLNSNCFKEFETEEEPPFDNGLCEAWNNVSATRKNRPTSLELGSVQKTQDCGKDNEYTDSLRKLTTRIHALKMKKLQRERDALLLQSETARCGDIKKMQSETAMCGDTKKMQSETAMCGDTKKMQNETAMCGDTKKMQSETAMCDDTKKMQSETAMCGDTKKMQSETAMCGDTKKMQNETAMCGDTKKMQSETAMCGDTKKMQNETAMCGDTKKMQSETAMCGDTKKMQRETARGDDIKKMQRETAMCDDTKKVQNETAMCGDTKKMQSETAMCGDTKKMQSETAMCGDTKEMQRETARGDDIKKMQRETAMCDDTKKMQNETAMCGDTKKMQSETAMCGDTKKMQNETATCGATESMQVETEVYNGATDVLQNEMQVCNVTKGSQGEIAVNHALQSVTVASRTTKKLQRETVVSLATKRWSRRHAKSSDPGSEPDRKCQKLCFNRRREKLSIRINHHEWDWKPAIQVYDGHLTTSPKFEERYGVLVAQTVINTDQEQVPLRVLNITAEPVRIYKASGAAIYEPVAEIRVVEATSVEQDGIRVMKINEEGGDWVPEHLLDLYEECAVNRDAEQRKQLRTFLKVYADVIARSPDDMGRTGLVKHTINTGTTN